MNFNVISYWVGSWEKKNYKPLIEMINLISVWLYIDYVFRLFIYFAIHEMFFLNWSHHFRICGGVCACARALMCMLASPEVNAKMSVYQICG